jgi:hypothetical protein
MKNVVTAAEPAGGWVIFTFHHVCAGSTNSCGDGLSISQTNFASFLSWLKARPATTSVKTIGQVIGGTVKPLVSGPPPTATTSVVNPSLELADAGAVFPTCWMPGGWGTNTPTWTRTSDAFNGSFAQNLVLTGYSSGDAKLLPTFDLGSCSPAVTPGATYTISSYYKSTGTSQFALYYRDSAGAWYYWTSSPWFAPASSYTQATFTTPPVPANATGMSFGLALIANGSLTTDQYSLAPASGATAATKVAATPLLGAVGSALAPNAASSDQAAAARKQAKKPKKAKKWGKYDRPFLPGEGAVKRGGKVAPVFQSDSQVEG